MIGSRVLLITLSAVLLFEVGAPGVVHAQHDFQRPPIDYDNAPVDDPIYRLKQAIEAGEVTLERDERLGWLPAVLEELDVPTSSQTLVFSRTSLQRRHISPSRPRALYFSDNVYVGYVRHGKRLELSAVDPHLGAVFYTVRQADQEQPRIERDQAICLSCHANQRTKGVPGYLVRSVFADKRGEPLFRLGTVTTDHTTPLAERFGGWYVTGRIGGDGVPHRGNTITTPEDEPPTSAATSADRSTPNGPTSEPLTLDDRVRTDRYPEPGSDLVALMVLEHQSQAHNLITRAAYQARVGAHFDQGLNQLSGDPPDTQSDSTRRRIERSGEQLLEYLLFSGEAPLPGPIEGSSSFVEDFAGIGPRDTRGRSLREFDLKTRLFRYPCSFLIYSESIDALPPPMRDYLRRRLTEVLVGEDRSPPFEHLTDKDRLAIFEILRETKPDRLLADAVFPAD